VRGRVCVGDSDFVISAGSGHVVGRNCYERVRVVGARVKVTSRDVLHEFADSGEVKIPVEIDVSHVPWATGGHAQKTILDVLEQSNIRNRYVSEYDARVSHNWSGLVGANDCKCSWDQRLNVPSEERRSSR
jgi:hypothetical protein